MKFMFFFMGLPMFIMSFFEAIDVLPYVQNINLIVDGHEIVLSQEEQELLHEQIVSMFEGSHTMPALGVVFDDLYKEEIKTGTFVSLKFDKIIQVNELPFDELVFKVEPNSYGFNLMRGIQGVFEGRCIYIDLNGKNMNELFNTIKSLSSVSNLNGQANDIKTVEE